MIPPAEGILLCCCLSLLEQESRRWEGAWIPALAAGRLGGRWGQLEEGGLSGEEASEALLSMSPPAELTEQSGLCFQTEDGEGRGQIRGKIRKANMYIWDQHTPLPAGPRQPLERLHLAQARFLSARDMLACELCPPP